MNSDRRPTKPPTQKDLPFEIYVSMVDALYEDVRSFLLGLAAALAGTLYAAIITTHPVLKLFPALIILVGAARMARILAYRRAAATVKTYREARRWERDYTFGTNAFVFSIGLWCFATFQLTDNAMAHLFCVSVALSYAVGVTGRNFANARFVDNQIVLLSVPLCTGMILTGVPDYMILACFAFPFFLSIRNITRRLRDTLLNAVIAQRDVSLLADRFDTALNNMPHGLAMFDSDGRLLVVNRRWSDILPHLSDRTLLPGMGVEAILRAQVELGLMDERSAGRVIESLAQARRGRAAEQLEFVANERNVVATFQPMESGGFVVVIEDITEKRRAEAHLAYMSRHDALTGLPNRSLFQERLEAALAVSGDDLLAVLFVDLDNFQQINDTVGHAVGDSVLIEAGDRLRFCVGENDIVARFGADEFVVLQTGARAVNDVTTLAAKIIDTLSEITQIGDVAIACGASVGIALAPRDAQDAEQLLKNADMALKRAKDGGKGMLHFYEEEMDRKAQARRAIELDLRHAIQNDELAVYFQPLMNLKTLTISTCEALVRWPHAVRGMVSPGEFIPIAEETGLIVEIGRQVLRKACQACVTWPGGVRVAVNLSSVQFERDDIVALVAETLEATGLAADRLELEITETLLLQDSAATLGVLKRLRGMGVRLALDDFGTGYSSLSYLHTFPLHKVKIDRSFVRNIETDPKAEKLLRGVTRLSAELGLAVAVEGVETHAQLRAVDAPGVVSEIQGFILSPAVPAHQLRVMLGRPGAELLAAAA